MYQRLCRPHRDRKNELQRDSLTVLGLTLTGMIQERPDLMTEHRAEISDSVRRTVAHQILSGLESLLAEVAEASRPLEVEPYRGRLFEFFVTADGAGLVGDERHSYLPDDGTVDETDLSADGLCRSLSRRWGLDMAARESAASQTKLAPEQLEQMRSLWSLMRMWMEWNYAWCRWAEFHAGAGQQQ